MVATATSTAATNNWADDAAWAISGVGTASGADGVLASGVLTPTVSPAWTVGALVGRRIKLDATWYSVSANTATTATITSPPADATYSYLLGGAPIAGDACIISDGTIMTLNANPSINSLTAAGNTGYLLCATNQTITITGTGVLYGGTLAAGFIRVSANKLTITSSQGAGTTVVKNTSTGKVIVVTGTGACDISNSGGTAVDLTANGYVVDYGGSGTGTITGACTNSSTGILINLTAGTLTIVGNVDLSGASGYGVRQTGGTFTLQGLPLYSTASLAIYGTVRQSGGTFVWTSTRTVAANQCICISTAGVVTTNWANLALENSGLCLFCLAGTAPTLTGATFKNMAATGQIVELKTGVLTITGASIPSAADTRYGVTRGWADGGTGATTGCGVAGGNGTYAGKPIVSVGHIP